MLCYGKRWAIKGMVFAMLAAWIFSGWPRVWETPTFPPKIKEAKAAVTYVGGQTGGFAGTSNETTVDFSLTNGSDATPAAGDLVIVAYSVGSTANRTLYIRNASAVDFTLAGSELYQNDSYDSNLRVAYRFMPATPETSIVLSGTGSSQSAGAYAIHVFRGVDPDTPLDVAAVTDGNTNTRVVNPAAITPSTSGAWIYVAGAGAGATGGSYTASYLTDFRSTNSIDLQDAMVGAGYVTWSSGEYDPAAFSGGGTDTASDSWTAVTLALRPATSIAPDAPVLFSDDGGVSQIAFNDARQNDATPIVSASSTYSDGTFNRFQVEFNTAADFTGTAYTETFSDTYTSDVQYNLQTTASLSLPSTNGATYYVRARASADGGSNYGDWSSDTWTYTYKSSGDPEWFQTTTAQFETGTESTVQASGGSVGIVTAAITKTGSDTNGTGYGSSALPLTFSHTLVAGSNRMVIVAVGIENDGAYDIASVTYGGRSMTKAADASTGDSGYTYLTELWYLLEADLPSDGAQDVTINGSGTQATDLEVNAFAAEYADVGQGAPDPTDGYAENSPSDATIENTISPSVNQWVISAVGCGNAGNFSSHGQDQVEAYDFSDGSSGFAVTELQGATGSETSLDSTFDASENRMARVAAAWSGAPAASGSLTSPEIDFGWVPGMDDWDEVAVSATTTHGSIVIDVFDENDSDTGLGCTISGGGSSCVFDVSSLDPAGDDTRISLKATLTDSGGTPYLNDWSVSWTVGAGGELTSDIVDGAGSSVASPFISMTTSSFSFASQSATGTLGTAAQKIRVNNTTSNPEWTLTIAASSSAASWDGGSADYDFNDPTADAGDGPDGDALGGQLTVDPSGGTITPQGGCSATGLSLGSSNAFNEGTTDSITLVTAGAGADTSCFWDITGIDLTQTIPAAQDADAYRIDMTVTVTAI